MSKAATKTQNAAEELEQAQQGVQEVLDRIKDGDKKVGPDDLETAERRVRLAKARLEGEERRKAEEAERERQRRLEELKERAASELDLGPIEDLRKAAAEALSTYAGALVAREASIDGIAGDLFDLSGLGPLPEGWSVDSRTSGRSFAIDGHPPQRVRPITEVSRIAYESLREHIPYGFIDLEKF